MKKIVSLSAAVLSFGIASSAFAFKLEIVNKSKTAIHHLYLSTVKQKSWGPDQLGDDSDDTIEPGDTFTLKRIEPGDYDVKIVAEDGTECEVDDAEFDESKQWVITERMLDKCDDD